MKIFRAGHVDPLCMFNENIQNWSCEPSMHVYPEFVMWTLYACLMKIFRVGHVDPLCMFNGKIQSWSC